MINILLGALGGIIITAIVFTIILWRMPDEDEIKTIKDKIWSIECVVNGVMRATHQCKDEIIKETKSLQRQLHGASNQSEDKFHKALGASILSTEKKLKALVEYLDLIYFPEGETKAYHKAHFKPAPHIRRKK